MMVPSHKQRSRGPNELRRDWSGLRGVGNRHTVALYAEGRLVERWPASYGVMVCVCGTTRPPRVPSGARPDAGAIDHRESDQGSRLAEFGDHGACGCSVHIGGLPQSTPVLAPTRLPEGVHLQTSETVGPLDLITAL